MTSDALLAALRTATDTRVIVAGDGVLGQTGAVFADMFPGQRALLVADENTWAAAGEAARAALAAAGVGMDEPLVFPGRPTLASDYEHVVTVRERLAAGDAYACSLASGTLNDIVKLASGELGRPYLNVCTAASMDGYAAFASSITRDGFKINRPCPAPAALIAPLDIMRAAPARLKAQGYGDIIEKIPAGADWIIADELGIEPIQPDVWELVQPPVKAALADPEGVAATTPEAMSRLVDALMLSGLAMQAMQSSRPASGAGHNFSHQWEMEGHGAAWDPPLSHGLKVGLGTIALCALYEQVLRLDLTDFDVDARVAAWPSLDDELAKVASLQPIDAIREAAFEQYRGKYVPRERAGQRLRLIVERWPRIIDRAREQVLPAAEIARRLEVAGAVHHPSQIDVSLERLHRTYFQAQTIRSRYTVLDLLSELGLLTELVDRLFAPGGYWAERG